METQKFEFWTNDLNEAAYVWSQSDVDFVRQKSVPRKNGYISVEFCFTGVSKDQFLKWRQAYYNRKATVEPRLFYENRVKVGDVVKSVIRSRKGGA